jgi:hypothetical protein
MSPTEPADRPVQLDVLLELDLGARIGQLRAMPVSLGDDQPDAILLVHGADFDIDPYVEMFFFPEDTLKMVLVTQQGEILWRRDLGRGVVPGIWFCPVHACDLDGDGVDEIWYVNNIDPGHPLGLSSYRLQQVDARTGRDAGQWPWPSEAGNSQSLSHTFRNFILSGYAGDDIVLVTAQGTYEDMYLQGWTPEMTPRWAICIGADEGARGSHMSAVADLNGDGVQAVLWGEHAISLDTGQELFCADCDRYHGHSDIVQPVLDPESGRWYIYTCRESDPEASPRVVLYDDQGERRWGHVEQGHIDMGWAARIGQGASFVTMAIRIGHKTCGPDGRFHYDRDAFTYDLLTGEEHPLPFDAYGTLPVDFNGDGYHELVRGLPGQNGDVLDRQGNVLGSVGGPVAMLSQFMDHPGEQVLVYQPDGVVRVWGDRNAVDSDAALARYRHPFYRANQRLTGTGYNLPNLGGI